MNTTHQIWFCTETKKYEVKPVNPYDKDELYAWSPHNVAVFNEENGETTYTRAIAAKHGLIWNRVPDPSKLPPELIALIELILK